MARMSYLVAQWLHPAKLVGTLKAVTCADWLAFVASAQPAVVVVL